MTAMTATCCAERCWRSDSREPVASLTAPSASASTVSTRWTDYAREVARCAAGLRALGLRRGERVAIMGDACEEWLLADQGAQAAGAIVYGIYPTAPRQNSTYQMRDGGASVFVAEDQEYVDKILPLARSPAGAALDRGRRRLCDVRLSTIPQLTTFANCALVARAGVESLEALRARIDARDRRLSSSTPRARPGIPRARSCRTASTWPQRAT